MIDLRLSPTGRCLLLVQASRFVGASLMERNTTPPGRLLHRRIFHSFHQMHARQWWEDPLVELHIDQESFSNRDCSQVYNMIHKCQF